MSDSLSDFELYAKTPKRAFIAESFRTFLKTLKVSSLKFKNKSSFIAQIISQKRLTAANFRAKLE